MNSTPVLLCLPHPIHPPPFSACLVSPEVDYDPHHPQAPLPSRFQLGLVNRRDHQEIKRQGEREVGHFSETPHFPLHGGMVSPDMVAAGLDSHGSCPGGLLPSSRPHWTSVTPAPSHFPCGNGFPLLLISRCLRLPSEAVTLPTL